MGMLALVLWGDSVSYDRDWIWRLKLYCFYEYNFKMFGENTKNGNVASSAFPM
jgi:hypothetical protein